MTPDDLKDSLEDQFYAVMGLIRVLCSFEYYPWRKRRTGIVGFANITSRSNGIKTYSEEHL
jgi:hypothetical protein